MTLIESTTSAVVLAGYDEDDMSLVEPADAERIILAFLDALGELGTAAITNSYRVFRGSAGVFVEVFDDGSPAIRTYGTPAPVEEIAEFLGETEPEFKVGDKVRVTDKGEAGGHDGSPAWHAHDVGAEGTVTSLPGADGVAWALGHFGVTVAGTEQALHPSSFERLP